MKLLVIGLGQCGGRIADGFARLNKRARAQRRIDVIPDVFAVNTDTADLTGLYTIKADYQHRILIGGERTRGHGVAKINEVAAEIAEEDGDKVIDAIRSSKQFYETDAFLLIAGTAGGTGSGAISVLIKIMKERQIDKPVYAVLVLPFTHEETEKRTIYNTAVCLKSTYTIADAVFLIDNQIFVRKDTSLSNNITKINEMIVEPFYNLLCAGEEKNAKRIGSKVLDAGDITQTLSGWTALGHARSQQSLFRLSFGLSSSFLKRSTEIQQGAQIMGKAISELLIECNPKDANSALHLISAPSQYMNMELIEEIGNRLRDIAPQAEIRSGDYPGNKREIDLVVILSQLRDIERVREYYNKATDIAEEIEGQQTKNVTNQSPTRVETTDISDTT